MGTFSNGQARFQILFQDVDDCEFPNPWIKIARNVAKTMDGFVGVATGRP